MPKVLPSFAAAALQIAQRDVATVIALHQGMEHIAVAIENTAREEFGVYQPKVGEFPAWKQLADATQEERERQGFTPNDPLLRTGDLQDSLAHETEGFEAVIGSTSEIMVFHEMGTSKMPPRPVLGPAAVRNEKTIEKVIGAAVVAGLIGGARIGYKKP
jgi:phage gpG-like protein